MSEHRQRNTRQTISWFVFRSHVKYHSADAHALCHNALQHTIPRQQESKVESEILLSFFLPKHDNADNDITESLDQDR
jgi:hypothetical protein